ncbi:MAG TPA: L-rhamnose/proton symporter RhaT [Terriglobia bacterium]|nr:L-rhamnose/proton symporter RhaT [Terriglobia bacterium]
MEKFWLGMAIILLSGVLNGSFALPLKYSVRWKWENTWLVFSVVGILSLPWLMAVCFVPHLADVYRAAPAQEIILAVTFGFIWGIAQATYGLSLVAVGLAVAVAVVSGLVCVSGALIPLLILNPAALFRGQGIFLLCSLPVLLVGLGAYAIAGRMREREQPTDGGEAPRSMSFKAGLGLCIFTGLFASAFNLGFAFSGDILHRSLESGAVPATAGYGVWSLVLGAGFIPNILYCAYLLRRNRTFPTFFQTGWFRETGLAVSMALVWLSGLFLYGWGATLCGEYGTSIGFTLFMAMTVASSSILGVSTGEWDSTSKRSRRLLASGVAAILLSVAILNLGGLLGR